MAEHASASNAEVAYTRPDVNRIFTAVNVKLPELLAKTFMWAILGLMIAA